VDNLLRWAGNTGHDTKQNPNIKPVSGYSARRMDGLRVGR